VLVLFVLKDRDEQLVAALVHAVDATLLVLQQLREDGVSVAECSFVHLQCLRLILHVTLLHQIVQTLEEIQSEKEVSVVLVPCKV
jgi:hypothetical protein